MPNWCFNTLQVSKHNESGRRLIDAFRDNHTNDKGEKYSSPFTDLYPCPQELMDTEASFGGTDEEQAIRKAKEDSNLAKYGHTNWYSWRLANWGTKWDACEVYIEDETDHEALIRFDTAWCSPDKFLEWYARENPDVVFLNQYDEEGMSFEGFESMSPESGFRSESWEPVDNRIPSFCDLQDEIPEAVEK